MLWGEGVGVVSRTSSSSESSRLWFVVVSGKVGFSFRFETDRVRFGFGVDLVQIDREKRESCLTYLD